MNGSTAGVDSPRSDGLRFPTHPIAGLAGTSFKHEHLTAILAGILEAGAFCAIQAGD